MRDEARLRLKGGINPNLAKNGYTLHQIRHVIRSSSKSVLDEQHAVHAMSRDALELNYLGKCVHRFVIF